MSKQGRLGLLVGAMVVLVIAFVALSPAVKEDNTATTPTKAPVTTTVTETVGATATQPRPVPKPKPAYTTIRVRAGKPVGGVRTIAVTSGKQARIEVRSPDTSDEVHLHGYDISRDLKAGGRARFAFKADAEGIFEMELEGAHALIAKVKVQPGP